MNIIRFTIGGLIRPHLNRPGTVRGLGLDSGIGFGLDNQIADWAKALVRAHVET